MFGANSELASVMEFGFKHRRAAANRQHANCNFDQISTFCKALATMLPYWSRPNLAWDSTHMVYADTPHFTWMCSLCRLPVAKKTILGKFWHLGTPVPTSFYKAHSQTLTCVNARQYPLTRFDVRWPFKSNAYKAPLHSRYARCRALPDVVQRTNQDRFDLSVILTQL